MSYVLAVLNYLFSFSFGPAELEAHGWPTHMHMT